MWFTGLILLVGAERVAELVVARRNATRSFERGGIEAGAGHYPVMVALHTALLVGALVEVWTANRPFVPGLGWPMLGLVIAAQALRWWCIRTLGHRWNTRVIVIPGAPLIETGPYRYLAHGGNRRWRRILRHPNYVAVVVEGFALPLVHSAWVTALTFTVLNGVLLAVRIKTEERALARWGAACEIGDQVAAPGARSRVAAGESAGDHEATTTGTGRGTDD